MEEVAVMEDLLGKVLQPETKIVMEAGKQLNLLLKKPKSIEVLFIVLHHSQLPGVGLCFFESLSSVEVENSIRLDKWQE